jgi:hypothetical protein
MLFLVLCGFFCYKIICQFATKVGRSFEFAGRLCKFPSADCRDLVPSEFSGN